MTVGAHHKIRTGRKDSYTPEQDAQILAAKFGTLGDLADRWGRTQDGLREHRRLLQERQEYQTKYKSPWSEAESAKPKYPPVPYNQWFARPDFFEENLRAMTKGAL